MKKGGDTDPPTNRTKEKQGHLLVFVTEADREAGRTKVQRDMMRRFSKKESMKRKESSQAGEDEDENSRSYQMKQPHRSQARVAVP